MQVLLRNPRLEISLTKLKTNTQRIVALCRKVGVSVLGVTKACLGAPELARAMIKGGVVGLADSRLENLERLRKAGFDTQLWLVRLPMLSAVDDVVRLADGSLNSEYRVIKALSEAATKQGVVHKVVLMVELGDLREGLLPEDAVATVGKCLGLDGIQVVGLGTNLTCFGGVIPTEDNLSVLVRLVQCIKTRFGLELEVVSGGNSSSLPLVLAGRMVPGINELRIGEGILLGHETVYRRPIPGTYQDAFRLIAEIIEVKDKPSVPQGEIGTDAFGRKPDFEDKGVRRRAILGIGRQDVDVEGLRPEHESLEILGASSDHLLVDVTESRQGFEVGDELALIPDYKALLGAMTSPYVRKVWMA